MITMTESQWNELKARLAFAAECMAILRDDGYGGVKEAIADLNAAIAEIDDENTRARYMALAAEGQLGLF